MRRILPKFAARTSVYSLNVADGSLRFFIALAAAALFSGIKYDLGFGTVGLFEVAAILSLLVLPLALPADRIFLVVPTLPLLFLLCHAGLATGQGLSFFAKEAGQVCLVILFWTCVSSYLRTDDADRLVRLFAKFIIAIMVVAAVWHVANGRLYGWKLLGDAKSSYLIAPAIVAYIAFRTPSSPLKVMLVLAALMIMMIFSGERKAYVGGGLTLLVVLGLFNPRLLLALATISIVALVSLLLDPGGYLSRQINSLSTILSETSLSQLSSYSVLSISNAVRNFAFVQGIELFKGNVIFGSGTGGYVEWIARLFPSMPDYVLVGIHNEFFRVLVENGLFGYSFYVSAWIFGACKAFKGYRPQYLLFGCSGDLAVRASIYIACFTYCAFEASKSLSMIALLAACSTTSIVPSRPARGNE